MTVVHTVVETASYLASGKAAGMTAQEIRAAVDAVAVNPRAGEMIVGSGGCRKVRIAGRGKGKSGGYRVISYVYDERSPVFLLAVLSKGSDANFSDAQVNALARATKTIVESLGPLAQG